MMYSVKVQHDKGTAILNVAADSEEGAINLVEVIEQCPRRSILKVKAHREISFTRINNDTNGNPRYVCHFLVFTEDAAPELSISDKYLLALGRAKKIGGRKFSNKQYGGGIAFQSYSLPELSTSINNILI